MLVGDFAELAAIIMLPLVLIGGLLALLVSGLATVVPPESRLTRLSHAGLAAVLIVAAAWLVLYAHGDDTYYGGGVSRWEHPGRGGGTFPVASAISIAAVTSLGLVASALAPGRHLLRLVAAPAAALSCFLLVFGWLLLTAGH